MKKIRINTECNLPNCPCEIVELETGKTLLVQTEWDYPGFASTFGWQPSDVQQGKHCTHKATDGTVDCPACGLTASDFIAAAKAFLESNHGAEAEDPGYFHEVAA